MVGVCCASWIQRTGKRVVVLDRNPAGTGTSYGTYLYGDFCTGEIFWSVDSGGGNWSGFEILDDTFTNITGFGEDETGNIYYTSFNSVVRISDDLIFTNAFD